MNIKKISVFLAKILFSLIVAFYFYSKIDFSVYAALLSKANIKYLLLSIIFYCFNLFIFAEKWKILLQMMDVEVKYWHLFKANLIGLFYGLFLPGGFLTGELVKFYKISKEGGIGKIKLLFSIVLDRLTGAISFVFLGFLMFIISPFFSKEIFFVYLALFLGFLLIYLILTSSRLNKLKIVIKNYIFEKINDLTHVDSELIKKEGINKAIFYGVFFQLSITLGVYFIVKSVGENINFIDLIWVNSLVSVATMIPVSFLGIGLREFSLVFLFGYFGFFPEISLTIATLMLAVIIFRGLFGGVLEIINFFKPDKN